MSHHQDNQGLDDRIMVDTSNAAIDAREPSLLAQILPVGRLLREHGANQYCSRTGNDCGVRDVGGMVRLWDERRNRGVRHGGPQTPGGGEWCRIFRIVRGDVGVHLQSSKRRQQPHLSRHTEPLPEPGSQTQSMFLVAKVVAMARWDGVG
jgi:hypothetical protein